MSDSVFSISDSSDIVEKLPVTSSSPAILNDDDSKASDTETAINNLQTQHNEHIQVLNPYASTRWPTIAVSKSNQQQINRWSGQCTMQDFYALIPWTITVPWQTNPMPSAPPLTYAQMVQRLLPTTDTLNWHYGEPLNYEQDPQWLRVVIKNVDMMTDRGDCLEWWVAADALTDLDGGILCFQETNLEWMAEWKHAVTQVLRSSAKHVQFEASSSSEVSISNFQLGGVAIGSLGQWAGWVNHKGTDPSGLGCWAYLMMEGHNGCKVVFVSIYWVCHQKHNFMSSTAYSQQYWLLELHGISKPDPQEQFINDLILQVKNWCSQGIKVFLGGDVNEDVRNPRSQILCLFHETDLVLLWGSYYGSCYDMPATHQRGSGTIDISAGSPAMTDALSTCCYLPFHSPAKLKGDHHTQIYDFDSRILFGMTMWDLLHFTLRGIISSNQILSHKFSSLMVNYCNNTGIFEHLHDLDEQQGNWTAHDHEELEHWDKVFTDGMLHCKQQCRKNGSAPWSPTLEKQWLIHHYWKMQLTQLCTGQNLSEQLKDIMTTLTPDEVKQGNATRSISAQLRKAQKNLHQIHLNAWALHDEYLLSQIENANLLDDKWKKRQLEAITRSEWWSHCHAMIHHFTKPWQPRGLAYIEVPVNPATDPKDPQTKWCTVMDTAELEDHLLEHSWQHFAQADGTPFTIKPLHSLISNSGFSDFSDQILDGTADINSLDVDQYTKLLLQHMQHICDETTDNDFMVDMIKQGIRIWHEATATSPFSFLHLSLYKSLVKHTKSKSAGEDTDNNWTIKVGEDVMMVVYLLLWLAVKHTHVYNRWLLTLIVFLEKVLGQPKIHRLWMIHLIEADFNLILKFYASKDMMSNIEARGSMVNEQGGGHHSHSAIDGAHKKVLSYDIIWMNCLLARNIDNDATACFDRMVENQTNLCCQHQGASKKYLKLHAQTHDKLQYFIWHKFGISKGFNHHSQEFPWHGSGQGTGDAPPWWLVVSDPVICAYNSKAHLWYVYHPDGWLETTQSVEIFIDDSSQILALDDSVMLHDLHTFMQENTDLWNGLITATGGGLNPSKGCISIFTWTFDDDGTPSLVEPGEMVFNPITLQTQTGKCIPLQQTQTSDAVRLLGVHITMDGNMVAEEQSFQKKCNKFVQIIGCCPLTPDDAMMAYKSSFAPSVLYPFPATFIRADYLCQLQHWVTEAFLSVMNYNRHTPWAVVYASTEYGGLGFYDFVVEQGIAQVLQLLKHCRSGTTLGGLLEVMINTFQLCTGIGKHILVDTQPLPHSEGFWLNSIHAFLHEISASISVENAWIVPCLRQGDSHIMEDFLDSGFFTQCEIRTLNFIWLYLWVTTLSDVTDHGGTYLLHSALTGLQEADGQPTLWSTVKSTLIWPNQAHPGKSSWCLWEHALRLTYASLGSAKLWQPLGPWWWDFLQHYQYWSYLYSPQQAKLYRQTDDSQCSMYPQLSNWWKAQYFATTLTTPLDHGADIPSDVLPVITFQQGISLVVSKPIGSIETTDNTHIPAASIPEQLLWQHELERAQPNLQCMGDTDFLIYLCTLPNQWECNLLSCTVTNIPWNHPNFAMDNPLHHILMTGKGPIYIGSDATMDGTKDSTFHWTVALYSRGIQTKLWSGNGPVSGPASQAHTGRSEGYGTLSALRFLYHFITYYGIKVNPAVQPSTGLYFCDNQGVITWVTELLSLKYPAPALAIRDDYDLYIQIKTAINDLSNVCSIQMAHVKGHQNCIVSQCDKLSYEAQLNIHCHSLAHLSFPTHHGSSTSKPTPQFPATKYHLKINNEVITSKLASRMRAAATMQDYHEYLCKKFCWTDSNCDSVQWSSIGCTLQWFRSSDQWQLWKFLHDWLPLNAFLSKQQHHHDPLCPTCQTAIEDHWHFLECNHSSRATVFSSLLATLMEFTSTTNTNPALMQLLWDGLQAVHKQQTMPPRESYPAHLWDLYDSQNGIGWDQLYHGCLSYLWGKVFEDDIMTNDNPEVKLGGPQWIMEVIILVWRWILELWDSRNSNQHGLTKSEKDAKESQKLQSQVEGIYALRDQLPNAAILKLFDMTVAKWMKWLIPQIWQWLDNSWPYIKQQLKAAKDQKKLGIRDIRFYFQHPAERPVWDNTTKHPP